jgi:ferritin-like protein
VPDPSGEGSAGKCKSKCQTNDGTTREGGAMCAEAYHEPFEIITEEGRDHHRALVSMIEELQAIDWYHQRVIATKDLELKAILEHNRDEEKEHAVMLLEYLRRKDQVFTDDVKKFLMSEGSITELEGD